MKRTGLWLIVALVFGSLSARADNPCIDTNYWTTNCFTNAALTFTSITGSPWYQGAPEGYLVDCACGTIGASATYSVANSILQRWKWHTALNGICTNWMEPNPEYVDGGPPANTNTAYEVWAWDFYWWEPYLVTWGSGLNVPGFSLEEPTCGEIRFWIWGDMPSSHPCPNVQGDYISTNFVFVGVGGMAATYQDGGSLIHAGTNSDTYIVCAVATNAASTQAFLDAWTAPWEFEESELPPCWEMTGGSSTGSRLRRAVDLTTPDVYQVEAEAGCSRMTNKVIVTSIDFQKDSNQKYGYDEYKSSTPQHGLPNDFISVKRGDYTTCQAVITPTEALPYLWSESDSPNTMNVSPVQPSATTVTLTITSSNNWGGTKNESSVQTRMGNTNGYGYHYCDFLKVEAYEERLLEEIGYYRVRDPWSSGTSFPGGATNPSLGTVKDFINEVWKQAVFKVNSVVGSTDATVRYDRNLNGVRDLYLSGDNLEIAELASAFTNDLKVAYVREFWSNFRLATNVTAGHSYVDLDPASAWLDKICPSNYYSLRLPNGANQEVRMVSSVTNNRVYFTSSFSNNHSTSETLTQSLAGLSTGGGLLVVTDAGNDLLGTTCHELLHMVAVLKDLSRQAADNVMFWTVSGATGERLLRYRDVDHQYGTGTCGSGTTGQDKQWDMIHQ